MAQDIPWPALDEGETLDEEASPDHIAMVAFFDCQKGNTDWRDPLLDNYSEWSNPYHISLEELQSDECYMYYCYYSCTGDSAPTEIDNSELETCECWT